jgi:hypothetical protein
MVDLKSFEDAAYAMKYAVAKYDPDYSLEGTRSSGSSDEYFKYIGITQRIKSHGKVVGYITYRTKEVRRKSDPVEFSSYEVFTESFSRTSSKKFRVEPDPKKAFRAAYDEVIKLCK